MHWIRLYRKLIFRSLLILISVSSVAPAADDDESAEPGFSQVKDFGPNPGNLAMYQYIPEAIPEDKAPLVVALHGCSGSAKQFSQAGFNQLAEKHGFFVLYPEQKTANNNIRCFNHSRPHLAEFREREAASVMQMIKHMRTEHNINRKQIFITGFSSGGQFANILAAMHPGIFKAAAIIGAGGYTCKPGHEGIPEFVLCAEDVDNVTEALSIDSEKPLRWPKISIWHGKNDRNVPYSSMDLAVEQWKIAHKIWRKRHTRKSLPGNILYESYKGPKGNVMIESYSLNARAHTVPVSADCGVPGGDFSLGKICFARKAIQFFGIH